MTSKHTNSNPKALVTVFEDLESAKAVVEAFHSAGFQLDKIELVTHNVHEEAPQVETPKVHETTSSSMVDSAAKWGGIGAGLGAFAAVLSVFPGVALGMIVMGGLTGAIMGGIGGIDEAIDDDTVDLPTLDEYEQLVKNGESLVVLLGSHDEVARGEDIVQKMYAVRSHIHPVHGHESHEHPAHK